MSGTIIETKESQNKEIKMSEQPKDANVASGAKLRWYIVHAYSGKENAVMKLLEKNIKTENLSDKFGEIIVPTEEVVEMRGGQKRKSERKFFPGYVLVQMEMNDQTWHLVRHTTWVLGFIGGTSDRPTPIPEKDIDNVLHRMQEGVEKPRPKITFQPGEVLRIINGPFEGFDAVVEDVNYEKSRLKVSVIIFGRSTPVELDFNQVQKV
jgi:transcription termination/antitermination protein NusG